MKDNNSNINHCQVRSFRSKYSSYIAAERWFKGGGNGRPRLLVPHSVTRGRWGRPSPGIRHMILTVRGATSTRISTVGAVAGSVRSKWSPRVESLFWTMIIKLEFVCGTVCLVLFASFLGEFLQLLLGDTQWLSCCLSEGNKAELVSCPQSWLNDALEEFGGETGEKVNWIASLILSGHWVLVFWWEWWLNLITVLRHLVSMRYYRLY